MWAPPAEQSRSIFVYIFCYKPFAHVSPCVWAAEIWITVISSLQWAAYPHSSLNNCQMLPSSFFNTNQSGSINLTGVSVSYAVKPTVHMPLCVCESCLQCTAVVDIDTLTAHDLSSSFNLNVVSPFTSSSASWTHSKGMGLWLEWVCVFQYHMFW